MITEQIRRRRQARKLAQAMLPTAPGRTVLHGEALVDFVEAARAAGTPARLLRSYQVACVVVTSNAGPGSRQRAHQRAADQAYVTLSGWMTHPWRDLVWCWVKGRELEKIIREIPDMGRWE